MDNISLNFEAYDDALRTALSGKEPGESVVLTVRAKVVSNSEESVDLETEEVMVDETADIVEDIIEDEDELPDDEAPAMVVAVKKSRM